MADEAAPLCCCGDVTKRLDFYPFSIYNDDNNRCDAPHRWEKEALWLLNKHNCNDGLYWREF